MYRIWYKEKRVQLLLTLWAWHHKGTPIWNPRWPEYVFRMVLSACCSATKICLPPVEKTLRRTRTSSSKWVEWKWHKLQLGEPAWVFELISQWGSIAAGDYGQAERQLSSRGGRIIVVSEWGDMQRKQGTWYTLSFIFTGKRDTLY